MAQEIAVKIAGFPTSKV